MSVLSTRRLAKAKPGLEQNSIGRDSYGYLHFPMIAGIVLVALGMKKTLEHTDEALKLIPAVAMLGGTHVCLRKVEAKTIFDAMREHRADH